MGRVWLSMEWVMVDLVVVRGGDVLNVVSLLKRYLYSQPNVKIYIKDNSYHIFNSWDAFYSEKFEC